MNEAEHITINDKSIWVIQNQWLAELELLSEKFPDAIGFQRIWVTETEEPCDQGCLAPGSSEHYHTKTTGWRVVFAGTVMEVDNRFVPYKSTVLHPPIKRKAEG